jgi:hypothetical protein
MLFSILGHLLHVIYFVSFAFGVIKITMNDYK